ncbi:3649_t:CDS:2, partial [Gigaspora rosea]
TQATICIQLPFSIPSDTKCLIVTGSDGNAQSFGINEWVDPSDCFDIPNYMAKKDFSYKFDFYSGSPNSGSSCSGDFLAETDYLNADVTKDPWIIETIDYTVRGIKIQVSEKNQYLRMFVLFNGYNNYVYNYEDFYINEIDNDGYFYVDYLVYKSAIFYFCTAHGKDGGKDPCYACKKNLYPNMASSPWTITGMDSCDLVCN